MLCPLCFALFMGLPFTCHVVIMPFIHIFIIVVPFSCLTLLFCPPLMFHMTNTLLLHLHYCYTFFSHYCSTFPSCFMCLPHPPLHFACLLCLSYVFRVLDLPFFSPFMFYVAILLSFTFHFIVIAHFVLHATIIVPFAICISIMHFVLHAIVIMPFEFVLMSSPLCFMLLLLCLSHFALPFSKKFVLFLCPSFALHFLVVSMPFYVHNLYYPCFFTFYRSRCEVFS